jgi:hypothetical protein
VCKCDGGEAPSQWKRKEGFDAQIKREDGGDSIRTAFEGVYSHSLVLCELLYHAFVHVRNDGYLATLLNADRALQRLVCSFSTGYIIISILLGALVGFALFTRDTLINRQQNNRRPSSAFRAGKCANLCSNDVDEQEKICC